MNLPRDIYCSLHGDVPEFEDQCPDYEFSDKTQKRVEKRKVKEEKKEKKGRSKIFPIILAIGGFLRAAMKGFEDPFGIIFLILGIGWLIVVLTSEQKK